MFVEPCMKVMDFCVFTLKSGKDYIGQILKYLK